MLYTIHAVNIVYKLYISKESDVENVRYDVVLVYYIILIVIG